MRTTTIKKFLEFANKSDLEEVYLVRALNKKEIDISVVEDDHVSMKNINSALETMKKYVLSEYGYDIFIANNKLTHILMLGLMELSKKELTDPQTIINTEMECMIRELKTKGGGDGE